MPDSWTVPTAAFWAHLVMTPLRNPSPTSASAARFAEAMAKWIYAEQKEVPWDFRTRQYRFDSFNEALTYESLDGRSLSELGHPARLDGGVRPPWTTGRILRRIEDTIGSSPDKKTLLRALDWLVKRGMTKRGRHGKRPVYYWVRRGRNEDWAELQFPALPKAYIRSCPLCREGWEHEACPRPEFLEEVPWVFPWSPRDSLEPLIDRMFGMGDSH